MFSLAHHVSHLENAENEQLEILLGLVFDLDNILFNIETELTKSKTERNYILEDTYHSIYRVSYICNH